MNSSWKTSRWFDLCPNSPRNWSTLTVKFPFPPRIEQVTTGSENLSLKLWLKFEINQLIVRINHLLVNVFKPTFSKSSGPVFSNFIEIQVLPGFLVCRSVFSATRAISWWKMGRIDVKLMLVFIQSSWGIINIKEGWWKYYKTYASENSLGFLDILLIPGF